MQNSSEPPKKTHPTDHVRRYLFYIIADILRPVRDDRWVETVDSIIQTVPLGTGYAGTQPRPKII